jgi:DNA-binding Lrp family transcriptional regulator
MKLDIFDLKILSQLDYDSRQSYSDIGKKIRRSKQFIGNRINNLKKNGVIEGYTVDFNLRKMGYTVFSIFFQFQRVDRDKELEIITYLKRSKYVGYCLKTLGNWDFFISVKSKGVIDFYNFLGDFHEYFAGLIKKESINLEIRGIDTNLKFLGSGMGGPFYASINLIPPHKEDFSKLEREVFATLRNNPMIPYLKLAEETGRSYETIKSVIKRFKDKKIIKRTRAVIDLERLGYTRYLFLIELHLLGNEELEDLFIYIKNHKNINYTIECLGYWNLICNVYSKDIYELMEIIEGLKAKFKMIQSIEFLRVMKNEKETFDNL